MQLPDVRIVVWKRLPGDHAFVDHGVFVDVVLLHQDAGNAGEVPRLERGGLGCERPEYGGEDASGFVCEDLPREDIIREAVAGISGPPPCVIELLVLE